MADTYRAVKAYQKSQGEGGWLRSRIRYMALDAFGQFYGLSGKTRKAVQEPRIQFIYIHHTFRDEEEGLRSMMAWLAEDHKFLSYSEAVDILLEGHSVEEPCIAFSSDDGMANNERTASILEAFGATCCFFVCPAMIGEQEPSRIEAFCRDRLHFPPVRFLDWKGLEDLQKRGHEVGNHTLSHALLSELSGARLEEEVGEAKRKLEARLGDIPHFAWPYGRFHEFSPEAKEMVFAAGHRSCASAERGCHVPGEGGVPKEKLCIRRDHVILDWPLTHVQFFLARNALNLSPEGNGFPY